MQFLGLCAGPPAPVDQRRSPAQIAQWRAAGRALVWTSAGHQRRSPSMAPLDWRWWQRLTSSAQAKIGLCAGPALVHQRRSTSEQSIFLAKFQNDLTSLMASIYMLT